MTRTKKIVLAVVLTTVVLAGSIGGVALAADGDDEDTQLTTSDTLLDRIIEIYQETTGVTIDKEALKDAFDQAREEKGIEPRSGFHFGRFGDDELTQEQQDELDAWLESRPDFPNDEFKAWMESRPEFPTDEYKEWMESKPDFLDEEFGGWLGRMPGLSAGPVFGGDHGHRGMGGFFKLGDGLEKFGCEPAEE
jgi:hypothetical protein